jgi:hypothetical protein
MESTLDRDVLLKQRSLAEVELLHDPLEAGAPLPKLGISSSQYAESIQSEPPKEIAKAWPLPLRPSNKSESNASFSADNRQTRSHV